MTQEELTFMIYFTELNTYSILFGRLERRLSLVKHLLCQHEGLGWLPRSHVESQAREHVL